MSDGLSNGVAKIVAVLDKEMGQHFLAFVSFLNDEKKSSPNTVVSYMFDIHSLLEFLVQRHKPKTARSHGRLTKQNLQDCNLADYREWVFSRSAEGVSNRSNARAISGVKRFFKFLNDEDVISNDVAQQMSMPKIPKVLPKTIDAELFVRLCEGIDAVSHLPWQALRDRAIATLMFTSGVRISEALAIKTKDLTAREHSIYVIGKGNKQRLVPIIAPAKEAIVAYIKACPVKLDPDGPLFVSNKGNKYSPRLVQRCFEDARRAANLPEYITPHTMRHSCATILLQNSTQADSIKRIQELLGHSQLATTQIYTQIANSTIIEALDRASYWNDEKDRKDKK